MSGEVAADATAAVEAGGPPRDAAAATYAAPPREILVGRRSSAAGGSHPASDKTPIHTDKALAWAVRELSAIAKYYDRTIQWRGIGGEEPRLLDEIDCARKVPVARLEELPNLRDEHFKRTLIVIDGTQDDGTIELFLAQLRPQVGRTTRVAILGRRIMRGAEPLDGWQVVRIRSMRFARRAMAVTILRPVIAEPAGNRPSLSIIIPARNERGNIAQSLDRLPDFGGAEVEVIFVEGHSTDGTWEEIERVVAMCAESTLPHLGALPQREGIQTPRVRALRQSGHGKSDAVRAGLAAATCDLVTILDADLTMPPESLQEFYEAYCEGRGDFINGDRLSLPMERGAMRPINKLGNRFFAWALSHVLETPLADCLCGTKLFARHDWQRFAAWRDDFGQRDPFGDFDLLFPAAALALGCVNVPIRYAARTYGETNIHRFRDGARLLAMTLAGWWRLRFGPTP